MLLFLFCLNVSDDSRPAPKPQPKAKYDSESEEEEASDGGGSDYEPDEPVRPNKVCLICRGILRSFHLIRIFSFNYYSLSKKVFHLIRKINVNIFLGCETKCRSCEKETVW